jgi:leucyl-tRNA synthetase
MEFLRKIEEKWQKAWENAKIFEADPDPNKKKFFLTVPYPYCSGSLHIGHGRTYTIGDIVARFNRMRGFNVIWPMAFHVTGTPVFGISRRIELGEKEVTDLYKEYVGMYETDPEKVEETVGSFREPWNVARYFANMIINDFKALGFSIDWRRRFTTGDKEYNSFVTWQFNKLMERGYITKGEYPILFCLRCENAVGEDDIVRGDEIRASVGEYILIKFELGDANLVAATMRPETVLGVTNIWANPREEYVKADVDGESWIVSERSIGKMVKQGRKIRVREKFNGRELIGKHVKVPVSNKEVVILPADFVDVNEATGVVYSVPAHAPWDYVGLKDLQEHPDKLKEYEISTEKIEKIKPISIIQAKGYEEFPAIEECQKFGVRNIKDAEKIDKATENVYKAEFYNGIMKPICGVYKGLMVQQAKEKMFEDLKKQNKSDKMYEVMSLEKPVECRCGGKVIVAVLPDQWFLNYGNEGWKKLARECLASMKIHPKIYRKLFEDTIEWLHERPCARKRGIGTPLPWDEKWIIESLSDSTIYMCLYTMIHHIKKNAVKPEQLRDEFWDYVLLNKGNPEEVEKATRIDRDLVEIMKREFEYWYPNDQRHSAVGHITNHLTFFIFNHAGIFAKKHWPKMISLNEYVIREGAKMSKSRGNVMPLVDIPRKYCADLYRLYVAFAADLSSTVDWRSENIEDIRNKLESLYYFLKSIIGNSKSTENGHLEKWLMSTLQHHISEVTENLEKMKTRTALEIAFFEIWNDFRWYIRRKGERKAKILKEALKTWVKLLAPFTPHICEEVWSLLGEKEFISLSSWPEPDKKLADLKVEEGENFIKSVMDDTQSIIRATKITPTKIYYYVATPWKWKLFLRILEKATTGKLETDTLVGELLKEPELRKNAKEVVKIIPKIAEEAMKMSQAEKKKQLSTEALNEYEILENAKAFLKEEIKAEVHVFKEDDSGRYDPKQRARLAKPYRPAIFIE